MSTTATETHSEPTPGIQTPPEITVLTRVASIPMISSGLETLNNTLSANAYTRSPYSTAKGLSTTAYKYTEPLQVRLAPLIVRADDYANKAVDVVESRYPYPFKAKPEDVVDYVRERRESASHYVHECVNEANKAIDEKVKSPARNVVHDIDQRFAPIVDYFEVAVSRLNNSEAGPSSPSADAKYQYQRALALSRTLKDNISVYSNEQLKQLQAQSVLIQRATETAHTITTLATSSLNTAQSRINTLSDNMLAELQKLQASTAALQSSLHSSSQIQSQIPPQIQQTYAELSAALTATVNDLKAIMTQKDLPLQEKVGRVGHEVKERVTPLLEGVRKGVSEVLTKRGVDTESKENGAEKKENGFEKNGNGEPPKSYADAAAEPPAPDAPVVETEKAASSA
ncbi:hypothetical protein BDQ12DRAFT_642067 [Crucibulum laeve]|uniref:Lipid droplet-associated perilipin protein n=1 Tax=Crucibulum laeve TaxID=68775 RepID=A0A5C3MJW4_9AGAR|nr:hypothetical protein BDQ12DRAFT_642067 [Crucibulum laeve]